MTSNKLKWIALIIMVLDHIAEFIGGMPIWFHWIGRLSAPIFLFCCVWSFDYTRSRKRYLIRLYFAGLVMSFVQYYFDLSNNIFRTLFSVCFILYILDLYKNKGNKKKYLFLYFFWQILTCILISAIINVCSIHYAAIFEYIIPALMGNIFNLEGGFVFVVLGVILYFYKNNTFKLTISFIIFDVFYFFASTTYIIAIILHKMRYTYGLFNFADAVNYILEVIVGLGEINVGGSPIFENYQWMMIFSLVFILLYNGKEGKKQKWFFYIFYPTHLIILSLLFSVY